MSTASCRPRRMRSSGRFIQSEAAIPKRTCLPSIAVIVALWYPSAGATLKSPRDYDATLHLRAPDRNRITRHDITVGLEAVGIRISASCAAPLMTRGWPASLSPGETHFSVRGCILNLTRFDLSQSRYKPEDHHQTRRPGRTGGGAERPRQDSAISTERTTGLCMRIASRWIRPTFHRSRTVYYPRAETLKRPSCPKHSNPPSSHFSCSRFWLNPPWPIPNTARTSQNAGAQTAMSSSPARRMPSTMRRHSAKLRERPSSIRTNSLSCCSSLTPICQTCRSSGQKSRIWPSTSAHSSEEKLDRIGALEGMLEQASANVQLEPRVLQHRAAAVSRAWQATARSRLPCAEAIAHNGSNSGTSSASVI